MLLPRNTNVNPSCETVDSSAAFQRTVGNTTNSYVLTFESGSAAVKDAKLNRNQSADILSAIDTICGTQSAGVSTTLCLSNKTQNPCESLVSPSSVARIARCPNVGLYLAQKVISKDANTFFAGIYSIVTPLNQPFNSTFDKCLSAQFPQIVLGTQDEVTEDATSKAATLRPANKKLSLLTVALVGASILAGTL